MARSRLEILAEEEAESQAERDRFQELADQYRQQSHLPPGGDQSWREREAMRRAAYDKGYAPPPGDPSWREHEAAQRAASHEPEPIQESAREEDIAGGMAEEHYALQEPDLQPVHVAKGGQGGTILIFVLVAAIVFGVTALAYPEMLTADYWRTAGAQTNSVPQSPSRGAEPAAQPVPPPVKQPAPSPALNVAPAPSVPPPSSPPAPDTNIVPAPPAQETPPPASPAAKAAPIEAPTPKLRPRAAVPDDRSVGGFYAKVPAPDGTMEYKYFPADPKSDARAPARKEPAVPDAGGFYAKAPGPDGTLQDRYFPRQPPPPR